MTQIGIGVEKGKSDDDAQLIINTGRPYVIQPHLQRKKPSTFLYFIAILLTLCVIVLTILGIVWLVRTHIWLSDLQKSTTTARPVPSTPDYVGDVGAESFNDQPSIKSAMTFDDIWTLRPKGFSGQWLNDNSNKLVYRNDSGDLVQHNFDDNVLTTLVPNSVFVEYNITRYYPNFDGSHVLLIYDEEKVWRHSFRSRALIYDITNPVPILFPNLEDLRTERLQYVSWAPKSNRLIFVQGNDIYFQNGPTGAPVRLTSNGFGSNGNIINGIPDWLYEEDVLSSARASYLSDDGKFLVFGRFNVTNVLNVEYPLYLPSSDVYSQQYKAAYPMAGYVLPDGSPGPNTVATLHLVDTQQTPTLTVVQIPSPFSVAHYFTRVAFVDADTVAITWTNRIQNEAYIQICDLKPSAGATPPVAECRNNFHQVVEDGWIDAPWPAPVANLGAGVYYTYLMSNDTSRRYKQLASIAIDTVMGEATFLTSGESEVLGVINYDQEADVLFYYSNRGNQRDRHIMMMNSTDPEGGTCITCDIKACDYASAQFSSKKDYFLLSCLGPEIPRYEVWEVISTIDYVLTMEDNAEFKALIDARTTPIRGWLNDIDLGNGIMGSADIYHPPNKDEVRGSNPLLVYVYAGPGSLQVTSRYGYGGTVNNWLRYLGSAFNIAVASVDARGTVGKGEDWKFLMYKKLATIEVDDQIAFGKKIKETNSYINGSDAAVFGWSYGGFVSSLVTGRKGDTTYRCGVAVAPVTSKRYYDTAYTERYLGLASENPEAYNATDLAYLAENFKDKKYFIAHGTHDDNVHFRNFATFVHALVEQEVQFRQQIYVDEDHSISSTHQSRHLFKAMTDFLNNDCYAGYMPPTIPPPPAHATVPRSTFTLLTLSLLVLFSATY